MKANIEAGSRCQRSPFQRIAGDLGGFSTPPPQLKNFQTRDISVTVVLNQNKSCHLLAIYTGLFNATERSERSSPINFQWKLEGFEKLSLRANQSSHPPL